MLCLPVLLLSALPPGAALAPEPGVAVQPPAPVDKLVQAYCDRHGLERKQLEPWPSVLAPDGRGFRYKVPAVPAEGKREALSERYALVFVDPDAGTVYDVLQTPGKGYRADPADRRLWAVLRLMGTTVGDDKRAAAVMADLYRARAVLGSAKDEPRFTVRLTAARKGETWADPAVTYTGTFVEAGLHLAMKVDDEGYVTEFYIGNVR